MKIRGQQIIAIETPDGYFEVNLCSDCLYAYHNGEPIGGECRNIFDI